MMAIGVVAMSMVKVLSSSLDVTTGDLSNIYDISRYRASSEDVRKMSREVFGSTKQASNFGMKFGG